MQEDKGIILKNEFALFCVKRWLDENCREQQKEWKSSAKIKGKRFYID